jgi:hypothetical protein
VKGEQLVARVHAHPRSIGPKIDSLLYAILGSPPAQPLRRLALVDPTGRQILKGVEARSAMPRSLINYACFPASSPSISLFQRPPSPPSWRNEKPRLRSCKLEPNATAIREGPTERKTALETTGSTTIRLRQIKIRC